MQVKGQAISPPHNYPVLKQESGIDWPGSALGDWTCQSRALPGRASPCKLDTPRIYEMCAKGLQRFSSGCRVCQGSLGRSPSRRARGGGLCAVWPREGGPWALPVAAALGGRLDPPTLSDQKNLLEPERVSLLL